MFKRLNHIAGIIVLFIVICLIMPKKAYAYLDPGSNSYLFQIAIASLLGIIFTIKTFFRRILFFFKKLFKHENKENFTK